MGGVRLYDKEYTDDVLTSSLPPEIIQDIFILCLPADTLYVTPSTLEAPLVLTTVSRAWRQLAIATPALWCSLSVRNPDHDSWQHKWRQALDGSLLWFSRAKGLPFRFSVCGAYWGHPILNLVWGELSKQCSHYRACLHDDSVGLWPHQDDSTDLSLLESFHLSAPYGLYETKAITRKLQSATNLKHLVWGNEYFRVPNLNIPWHQLTVISIDGVWTPPGFWNVLSQLHDVQRLVLSNTTIPPIHGQGSPVDMITLPHLELFSFCVGADCSSLLDRLTVPKLRQLGITYWANGGWGNEAPWFAKAFCGLVKRSECKIKSLNLYMLPLTETQLMDCISVSHQSLKELTLKMKTKAITDNLMRALRRRQGNVEYLCPQLEVLALYGKMACEEGMLAEVARSRLTSAPDARPPAERLKMIETSWGNTQINALLPLRSEGLLLRIYGRFGNRVVMPDKKETREENEAKFQQLLKDGLTWFAYPADSSTSHLEFDPTT